MVRHLVAAVVDDDVERPPRRIDDRLQEGRIALVSDEDAATGSSRALRRPD